MRMAPVERQKVVSFRVTKKVRRTMELLASRMTTRGKYRYSLTDVVEEAIKVLAKKKGIH